MARVRLIWVWLFTLSVAVMAGCGGDDSDTPVPADAALDRRTDAVSTDARSDAATDIRSDAPTADATPDTTNPPLDVRPDMTGIPDTARPPDADAGQPPRPDADASNPPPDTSNPPDTITPPDTSHPPDTITPPDTIPPTDVFHCTADSQCPTGAPHCNTTTGACVSPASVAVTPTNPSIALGTSQQMAATITYSDTSTGPGTSTVVWASSTTATATINAAGLVTSVAVGQTTISATLGSLSGSTTLSVTGALLTSIAVTPGNPSNPLGTTRQFTAIGSFSNNTTQDLSTQVAWASATAGVATINNVGLATTVAVGDSVISATSGAIVGSTTLTVSSAQLVSIAVTPPTPSIQRFTQRQMIATGTYTNNTTLDLTSQANWTTSDISVATVSNTAGSNGLVTGTNAGTSTITATANGVSGSTVVTVTGVSLVSISITPNAPTVAKGIVVPFTATGTYSDSSSQNLTTIVTWSSSDTATAIISNALGSQGLASTVNAGTSTITATYGSITASTLLTVSPATLVSIAVTPTNPSIAKGTTQQFAATGTYTDNSTQDITTAVTWASTSTAVGTVSNVTGSQGLATGIALGDTTIRATLSNSSASVSGATNLHVTNETLVAIGITPSNPTIAKGTDRQFVATGTYTDNSTQNLTATVTWNSSDNAIATISNAAGTEGKAHGATQGVINISATLSGVSGVTQLTVTDATLVSINLTPQTPSIPNGTTQQFTATGTYTDNSTQNLTDVASWSTSSAGVATVSNAAGTRGLATGNSQGTATITAAYQGVSSFTVLTVTTETLVSITVTPPSATIAAGLTRQFTATGTYSDGSTAVINSQVLWVVVSAGVASISNSAGSEGRATGLTTGETDITATLGTIVGTAHLTVVTAVLQSIAVTPTNPSVPLGTTQQFVATGTYSAGPTQDLTAQVLWSSSASSVATISNAAGSKGEATAIIAGSTTITANLNGISGTTLLTVSGAALQSITVTPANMSVANGTQIQYKAIGNYTGGTTVDLTDQATWSTTDGTKATVSNAAGSEGLATTIAVGGPFNVTAVFNSVTGVTPLTVTAAVLQSIAVTPATPSIARGTTQQFVATGTYSDATTQILTAQVSWGSSAPGTVSISNAAGSKGLATGVAAGVGVTITADLGGVSGSTTMTVTSATLASISVTPTSGGINPGDTRQYTAIGSYSDATTQDITQLVTWGSSVPATATISNAAGSKGLATGVATGTTSITATHAGPPIVVGTVSLTVN
jgi:hypothetical protein